LLLYLMHHECVRTESENRACMGKAINIHLAEFRCVLGIP
jgi:hypothetical protein